MRRFAIGIPKQLEAESARVKTEVDDRAYQIQAINSHRLSDRPVLETETEETHTRCS